LINCERSAQRHRGQASRRAPKLLGCLRSELFQQDHQAIEGSRVEVERQRTARRLRLRVDLRFDGEAVVNPGLSATAKPPQPTPPAHLTPAAAAKTKVSPPLAAQKPPKRARGPKPQPDGASAPPSRPRGSRADHGRRTWRAPSPLDRDAARYGRRPYWRNVSGASRRAQYIALANAIPQRSPRQAAVVAESNSPKRVFASSCRPA